MRNFNFKIDDDLDLRLKADSTETGVPMSEIVRRAIVRFLDDRERQRKRVSRDGIVAETLR